jgi:uncharacterized protein DUF2397
MTAMSGTADQQGPAAEYGPFAHLATPHAALYRQVMETFLTAKRRLTVHLHPENVRAALRSGYKPALEAVGGAPESLERWGNPRAAVEVLDRPQPSPVRRTARGAASDALP